MKFDFWASCSIGIAAIEQHALVAVDVGDARGAVGGGREARIVGEAAGVAVEPADVDDVGADGARSHRQMRLLVAANRQRCGLAGVRGVFRVHRGRPSLSGRRRAQATRMRWRARRQSQYYTFCSAQDLCTGRTELCDLRLACRHGFSHSRLVADAGQRLVAAKHGHDVEHGGRDGAAGEGGAQGLGDLAELQAGLVDDGRAPPPPARGPSNRQSLRVRGSSLARVPRASASSSLAALSSRASGRPAVR